MTTILFGAGWMHHAQFYVFQMNMMKWLHLEPPRPLGHLWSLAVEEQFYIFWPFAVFWLSETAVAWLAGSLLLIAPMLRWICTPLFSDMWPIYTLTPFRMDCLAAGALLAIVWHRRRNWIERFGHFGLVVTLAAGSALLTLNHFTHFSRTVNSPQTNTVVYELTLLASVGITLWALSGKFVGILMFSPIRYLGRISYSVYLIHILALTLVERYVHNEVTIAMIAAVGTLAYAALSWQFIEEPLLGSGAKEATVVLAESEKVMQSGSDCLR